ncbi:hypothetical protein LCGC14_0386020 [marine sediment metagenome]|uniref:DUF4355 domain-containing protein n=1 Tax=marine sediment metagenome TaxID=412755 RepID=A0A0F9W9T3_9ZZZZ
MDGPKQGQDSSSGDSSGDGAGTSAIQEQIDKAVNDARSADGRTTKDFEVREQRIKDNEAILTEERVKWRRERDEADIESVRDDPEALTALQKKQKAATRDAESADERRKLEEDQAKHKAGVQSDLEEIKVFNRTKLASEVAVAKGVSMDSILKHAKDDTREAMEAVAEDLPKNKEPLKVDSSRSSGTGEKSEEQRLKTRYPTMT